MLTYADISPEAVQALTLHYESIVSYLGWKSREVFTAMGVPDRESVIKTDYPKMAYRLGANI